MLLALPALAQTNNLPVFQSGLTTARHAPMFLTPGVIGDSGPAGGGAPGVGLSELGITNTGTPFCINDAPVTSLGGYHQFCLGANVLGNGALFSFNPFGGASQLGMTINLNGVNYPFPGAGTGNVVGPTSPTPTAGDLVIWNGGTTVKDGGAPPINFVVQFGGDNTGTNDNSVAMQTMYTNACNKTVFFPPGTYKFTAAVGTVHCWVNLQGNSSLDTTFDYSSLTGTGPFLNITGTAGTSTLLTDGLNPGNSTLLLTSASGFASGQYVYISSSDVCCSHYTPPGIIGEISYIDSLSGTTATLRGGVSDVYTLGAGAYAQPLTMLGPGFISGIHFKGPAIDQNFSGVQIRLAHNVKIFNNYFDNAGDEQEFEMAACWQCEIAHNQFSLFLDTNMSRDGYAIEMDGTVQDADVHDNQFFGYGTVDVGYGAAAGPPLSGIARRIHFHHNQLYAASAGGNTQGFETHGACEDVRVEDNIFYSTDLYGIQISCWAGTVARNSINFPTFVGVEIKNLSDRTGLFTVNDNYINSPQAPNGYGVNIEQGVLGTTAPYKGLQIARNHIVNSGSTGINFGTGVVSSTGVDVSNNIIDNPGNGGSANCIALNFLRDVKISGNVCQDLSTSVSLVIFTHDIFDMVESNNVVVLPDSSSATAFSNTATSSGTANHLNIFGNMVVGFTPVASHGLVNGSNVTVSTVGVNDFSQTTTPITAGAGAGNIVAYPIFGTTGSIGGSPLGAGACASGSATTTGSLPSMSASVVPNTDPGDTIYLKAIVGTNTTTVKVCSATGSTPTASTYNVSVMQ